MFDIISYWVVYTLISFMILAVPLYWMCDIIDIIIKDLTNGKFVNAFSDKFRNPWLVKIGFHSKTYPNKIYANCGARDIIIVWHILSIITLCWIMLIHFGTGTTPYEQITFLTSNITPYVSTPILLLIVFMLIRGVVKKAFSKYEDLESKLSKLK